MSVNAIREEAARAKRCCGPDDCGDLVDRQISPRKYGDRLCIGSGCMAWRWLASGSRELAPHSTEAHPAHIDSVRAERGYCGLAGAP